MAVEGKYKIEVSPEKDVQIGQHFWIVWILYNDSDDWCNSGQCGWEVTPQLAFERAYASYLKLIKNKK